MGVAARVRFVGEYPRSELPDVYASADAFLFTSRSETQGLVLVEALATGVPIVAVETPQTADVLGEATPLVPCEATALAAALRAEFARSDGRARLDRVERRKVAVERFDATALCSRVIALYDSLVDAPHARTRAREPVGAAR
ncbi:MAG: hypothetical protein NVS1B2_17090 [Vulcanimicrobiaceae bacterium]